MRELGQNSTERGTGPGCECRQGLRCVGLPMRWLLLAVIAVGSWGVMGAQENPLDQVKTPTAAPKAAKPAEGAEAPGSVAAPRSSVPR